MLETHPAVRSNSLDEERNAAFLIQVVHLYYQRRATQKEIAEKLGVSTMTISRALKRAEDDGIVEVRLHLPIRNDPRLETALRERLKLREVFVACRSEGAADDGWSGDARFDFLGRSAALFASPALRDGVVLGIALGRTVGYVAKHLPRRRLRDATVVQIAGGLGTSGVHNPYNLVQAVSERLCAQGRFFSGPLYVANREVQQAMLEENARSGLQDLWRACDLCLISVGSCATDVPHITSHVSSGMISPEELASVERLGAVGDILGRYFDANGKFVTTELHDRVSALPMSDLERIKQVVVTAGGPEKVLPIIGAARTGVPMSLVTDDDTARAVLRHLG